MRIKKTSQYIEGGAGLPSYFTDEIDTGMKWIDGKNIYRKVLTTTSISQNIQVNLEEINNVNEVVSIKGMMYSSGGFSIPFSSIWDDNISTRNSLVWADVGSTKAIVKYKLGSAWSSISKIIVIIEYTKA